MLTSGTITTTQQVAFPDAGDHQRKMVGTATFAVTANKSGGLTALDVAIVNNCSTGGFSVKLSGVGVGDNAGRTLSYLRTLSVLLDKLADEEELIPTHDRLVAAMMEEKFDQ